MSGPSGSSSAVASVLNNFAATATPTVTNDSSQGYATGSSWLVPGTGDMFRCRDASVGAARWIKIDVADHPGYTAGNRYVPFGWGSPVAGAANLAGTAVLAYGVVKERLTISQLGARISTVSAGGSFQLAIYVHNPASNGPGALVASTASGSTASATIVNITLASNVTLESGGYWFAFCADNAVAAALAMSVSSPSHISLLGIPATAGDAIPGGTSNSSQVTGISYAGTFGTWPADLTSATFGTATVTRSPMIQFTVASVP